jgi:hypothetical protein
MRHLAWFSTSESTPGRLSRAARGTGENAVEAMAEVGIDIRAESSDPRADEIARAW